MPGLEVRARSGGVIFVSDGPEKGFVSLTNEQLHSLVKMSDSIREGEVARSEMYDEKHHVDMEGRPAGGHFYATGIKIDWQNGPLNVDGQRREPNGAFVEDVIQACIGRIEHYQQSQFHCLENATALGFLKAAAEVLAERTRDRERRGVEGTHRR